ncbi:MAG: hypothetical protein P1P82_03415 [Bacteroidales bacterium]|nr:hypothetical protein [Bacteroidales bacterium]MDT8431986.1 hypothetical protein [Bacteroidales bacterium]
MKNPLITIVVLLLLSAGSSAQEVMTMRPYVRAGLNLTPPSLEDLSYSGDMPGAEIIRNPLSVGAGVQFSLQRSGLEFGMDVGATTMFVNTVRYDQGVGVSNYVDEEYSVYLLAFLQKPLGENFFIQGGLGPHICPWNYEYYYESVNYTDSYEDYSGVGVSLGLMLGLGTEVPLSQKASFFLLGKLDGIFRYGIMLPLTVNAGLSIDL